MLSTFSDRIGVEGIRESLNRVPQFGETECKTDAIDTLHLETVVDSGHTRFQFTKCYVMFCTSPKKPQSQSLFDTSAAVRDTPSLFCIIT